MLVLVDGNEEMEDIMDCVAEMMSIYPAHYM